MKCPKCHADNTDTARFCSNCATQLTGVGQPPPALTRTLESPAYALKKGSFVAGKYRIIDEIGRGGMGVVYNAEDTTLARRVAIKVLPEIFTGDPERLARFEREAKLLASLNHPNIATIHGLEETDGKRFLVMELVEGETLAERIGRGPLPIEQTLEVCLQIAEGVEAAHEKGIIHRDLKPANVKLTPEGKVKILDFGLAKAFRDEPAGVDPSQSPTITDQMTRPGVIMGTATYMSPEQARGKPADKRADIWAFGCILYESLTGKRAFEGETVTEIVAAILKGEPKWQAIPANLPSKVKDLLRRCLQKDPKERLHDIADARIEIQESAAQPAEIVTAALRPSFLWFAAIATIILLAGFAAWGWLRSHGGSGARQALHLPLSVKNPPRLRDIWGAGFALSRDGTRITYLTSSGWQLLDLVSGTSREITHEWQGEHAEFSPRGDSIIIRTGNYIGQLVQISLSTGNAKVLLTRAAGGEMHWQDDGWIYFGRQFGIVRVREQGGAVEELLMPDLARDNWLAVNPVPLPGEQAVIFTRRQRPFWDHSRDEICVFDLVRKTVRGLTRGQQAWYLAAGYLLVAQSDGAVFAAPFDLAKQELVGEAVKVLDGVATLGTVYGVACLKVADNGTLLYAARAAPEEDELVVVDRNGTRQRTVTGWNGWIGDGAISTDGKRVVVTLVRDFGTPNIWLRDLAAAQPVRISSGEILDLTPQFMADGRSVAFGSPREGKNWDLYVNAIGAGEEERVLLDRPGDIRNPCFSSGGWVVFCEFDSVQRDVFAHQMGTDVIIKIAATPADESMPAASPDSRWVAYQSDALGHNEVYVRPLQRTAPERQVSTRGGSEPWWSRSGQELFYVNAQRQLVSVRVDVTGAPAGQEERVLFSLGDLTWARMVLPNDQGFVMIHRKTTDAPGELVLVQNWFEELKRLVPAEKK